MDTNDYTMGVCLVGEPAKPLTNRKNRFENPLCDIELVEMTRPVVDILLSGNVNNRKVIKSNLECLASEFRAGRYKFTGEPIVRDEYGILRDGQHRLMALRMAGCPQGVRMLVITLHGERSRIEETYDKMNTGRSRKFGQLLEHKGVADASKVAALCKKIPYIETGYNSFPVRPDSYYLDVRNLYRIEIDAIAPLLRHRGFRADMGAAACVIAKVTGCLDEIVNLCKRAIDNNMLKVGTPEHTLNKIINDSLRATKKGQARMRFSLR